MLALGCQQPGTGRNGPALAGREDCEQQRLLAALSDVAGRPPGNSPRGVSRKSARVSQETSRTRALLHRGKANRPRMTPSSKTPLVDMCSTFPMEPEGCGEPKHRFFYNATSKTCEPFISRGCTWNLNQFYTAEECRRHCGKIEKPGSSPPSPRVITTECLTSCLHDGNCPNDQKCCSFGYICRMPPEKGPCHATVQNWYYDWETQKCKKFSYGGCLGNKNNFKKRRECHLRCRRRRRE
ncbi:hypothetical protein JRQ81_014464 [Phrynocephalus forsythii]|uniref:Uncharacterized protein n=1 Tax=Phrynocephalus forsythii TaxID=171643 RepID=A0A9Q0XWS6_9SAUR|nr:hypothetical protein JRQ81_014464 [Phrynocephalus forsythii]